eukprot:5151347-Alexandrium_andersonii.AAC.1
MRRSTVCVASAARRECERVCLRAVTIVFANGARMEGHIGPFSREQCLRTARQRVRASGQGTESANGLGH